MKLRNLGVCAAASLVLALGAANVAYSSTEEQDLSNDFAASWKIAKDSEYKDGIPMNLYDADGLIVGVAKIAPESWKGNDITQFTVRFPAKSLIASVDAEVVYVLSGKQQGNWKILLDDNELKDLKEVFGDDLVTKVEDVGGRFVTGLSGVIEKFAVKGAATEQMRIVFRNEQGEFVTWLGLNDKVTKGWNVVKDKETGEVTDWRYEIRWNKGSGLNGIVNSVSLRATIDRLKANEDDADKKSGAFVKYDGRTCPSLVLRDTADGINNGKIVVVVPGVHKVRSDGQRWCYYYPRESAYLDDNQQVNMISFKYRNK